jgi:hypothetical protein
MDSGAAIHHPCLSELILLKSSGKRAGVESRQAPRVGIVQRAYHNSLDFLTERSYSLPDNRKNQYPDLILRHVKREENLQMIANYSLMQ